jgi:hypothetical protein
MTRDRQYTLPGPHFDEKWKLAFDPKAHNRRARKLRKDIDQLAKDAALMPGFKPREKK